MMDIWDVCIFAAGAALGTIGTIAVALLLCNKSRRDQRNTTRRGDLQTCIETLNKLHRMEKETLEESMGVLDWYEQDMKRRDAELLPTETEKDEG